MIFQAKTQAKFFLLNWAPGGRLDGVVDVPLARAREAEAFLQDSDAQALDPLVERGGVGRGRRRATAPRVPSVGARENLEQQRRVGARLRARPGGVERRVHRKRSRVRDATPRRLLGPNSIEKFQIEFWLEISLQGVPAGLRPGLG